MHFKIKFNKLYNKSLLILMDFYDWIIVVTIILILIVLVLFRLLCYYSYGCNLKCKEKKNI